VVDVANDSSIADSLHVKRCGFTQVAFACDLASCTQTGRTDDVESAVATVHELAVDGALAGREAVLDVGYEVLRAYG